MTEGEALRPSATVGCEEKMLLDGAEDTISGIDKGIEDGSEDGKRMVMFRGYTVMYAFPRPNQP